tara:strand:- start:1166 stop:1369 length:204 start_codon:yes stop_codon:yes gene_type:complete
MTEQSTIFMNNLRGIQAEINRLQIQTQEKRNIRKQYITDCLNSGVKVKQIAEILKISVARVYKILDS